MLRKDVIRPFDRTQSTADPTEIARFDALAQEWWEPDGKFRVVRSFNAARMSIIADALAPLAAKTSDPDFPLAGMRIADIGCGAGIVSEPLAKAGARVMGIDASARNIEIARRHALAAGLAIDYRCALPEDLCGNAEPFDAVTCLEVVEHVADVGAFLDATASLVRPGGRLIVGTINRTARSWALGIVAAEQILGWLPRGTHDWNRFVKPDEMAGALSRYAFFPVALQGIAFDPVLWRWQAVRNPSVNYLQIFARAD
jgi:2-polyprenyl-6-hydroxyphenyl methylase/3-demethylubiquinone-9 3-methyltransferase